jgi:hypothetical protein
MGRDYAAEQLRAPECAEQVARPDVDNSKARVQFRDDADGQARSVRADRVQERDLDEVSSDEDVRENAEVFPHDECNGSRARHVPTEIPIRRIRQRHRAANRQLHPAQVGEHVFQACSTNRHGRVATGCARCSRRMTDGASALHRA